MKKFNGYWSLEDFTNPALKDINLILHKGKFYGLSGKVGSGKSSLLAAINR
jgi:ABC-type lipoprotein export system ATPase subunit